MKVRKWLCILLSALLILSIAGCGAENAATDNAYNGVYDRGPVEQESALYGDASAPGAAEAVSDNRKWIVTVEISAETEDMDELLSQLNERVASLDGYVEDQSVYNGSSYSSRRYRSANLTIRIPADRVDAFTEQVEGISNIVSSNLTKQDVTLSYVATESRMNALQAEETRLLELMAQAETMSDLLEIEARLTDVRSELESVTSQLRLYDNQVDYATIYLYIDEVQEYTPTEEKTVWQRIGEGFMDSLEGLWHILVELFVFVLTASPYLVVIAGIAALIVFLVKRHPRKPKAPKAPKSPDAPPEPPASQA